MTAPLEYDINGTPVENAVRWITAESDGAFGLPELRGNDVVLPGAPGEVAVARVLGVAFDEFTVRVSGLSLDGTPAADPIGQFQQNLRDLRELLWDLAAPLSVEKRILYPSGTVTYGPSDARCVGFTPRMESADLATVLIRLKVYDGWGGAL